ncbi:unnamed protein product, partial [marine sediment metagenome]
MKVKEILTEKERGKLFLLGNEAAVRGALEGGVSVVSTYPGTPSSEIGDTFYKIARDAGVYFEFSSNEKVALEVSAAAASAGLRSFVFNETVNLAILDRDEITYLYSAGSDNTLKLDLKIGSNQPAYCAAVGKVLLAYLSEQELDGYLQRVKLKSYTPYTITSKKYLKKDLKLIRERGYSFVNEEYMVGVSCVAVPIKDNRSKVCAGLSFSVPTV